MDSVGLMAAVGEWIQMVLWLQLKSGFRWSCGCSWRVDSDGLVAAVEEWIQMVLWLQLESGFRCSVGEWIQH